MIALLALAAVAETLAKIAEPWKNLYDDSRVVATVVVFIHLAALFVAGGVALAHDRGTLRALRGDASARTRQLAELGSTHRLVIGGLAVAFVSGVALFLADVETFAVSVAFWVKMGLVALLLLNGFLMTRAEAALRRSPDDDTEGWGRLRTTAVASAVLWLATLLAGVALTNAA